MQETKPLGAQISHMLKDRGVEVIFGVPGVHNQEMYRGIEEAGIRHVLARHEQGAGFMADGYARATGKPGVAYVITGPGLCNIMTAMGQAYSDSVSVLVLSSCLDETAVRSGQLHQMLDQEAAARTVCDWSYQANSAKAAYDLVDRALVEFKTQRPRSKHIQVPIALLGGQAPAAPRQSGTLAGSLGMANVDVSGLVAALTLASYPLFVIGGGAAASSEALRKVVGACGAACFETYAGRGVVGCDDSLNFGAALARPSSAHVMAQADCIVAIGTELAEVDLWRNHMGHDCPIYRIDIDLECLADEHRADVAIHARAEDAMARLLETLPTSFSLWRAADVAHQRDVWRAETEAERPGIIAIVEALRTVVPEDAMIYSDMTQFAYVANEVWPMTRPKHWHHPSGFGTLGYALPAAIGGAVARPAQPTMAIAGDYGFQYSVQELGTAVELGQALPIILWDNGKLKEIEDSMRSAQIAPNAVIAKNPDFVSLAKAYGAKAVAPATFAELRRAVTEAFAAGGPTVIYLTPEISA
jgi:5-guanidino-2-oxopentanoate decarboxylase